MGIGFNVRSYPESGHSEGIREMSAFDPKRTFLDQQLATVEQNQGERLEPKILSVL